MSDSGRYLGWREDRDTLDLAGLLKTKDERLKLLEQENAALREQVTTLKQQIGDVTRHPLYRERPFVRCHSCGNVINGRVMDHVCHLVLGH